MLKNGDNMRELGATIRRARRKKGLSQRDLGKLTGFQSTYIAKIELGRQRGSPAALVKIAKALDIPLKVIAAQFELNTNGRHKFSPEDYRFSELPPELKSLLLDLAETLESYKAKKEFNKDT